MTVNPAVRFIAGTALLADTQKPVSVLVDHVTEMVYVSDVMTFGDDAASMGNMMREILGMPDDVLTKTMEDAGALTKGWPELYKRMKADGAFDEHQSGE